jgi:co-chaperonin GroES (HSP10)
MDGSKELKHEDYKPSQIRPNRDWVLVLDDERREVLASGLILAEVTGAEKVTEGTGTLIRVGPGDMNGGLGIEPQMRVVYRSYLKYANPIDSEERWPSGSRKRYFLMSCKDLMGVVAPGVEVGVYSGRPQVPEAK